MRLEPPSPRSVLAACGCTLALSGAAGPQLASAHAQTTASLHATFEPYRLGRRTTLQFEFAFSAPAGAVPPPLTEMQLRYPRGINFFLNDLGTRICAQPVLEASGPAGCPPDSAMGYGVVRTGIVLGDTPVEESSPITILRAPERDGHLALLFFAEGREPIVTNVIFSGLLLDAREPFGGNVTIGVPSRRNPAGRPVRIGAAPARNHRAGASHLLPQRRRRVARVCAAGHPAAADVPSRQLSLRRDLCLLRRHACSGERDGVVSGPSGAQREAEEATGSVGLIPTSWQLGRRCSRCSDLATWTALSRPPRAGCRGGAAPRSARGRAPGHGRAARAARPG